MNGVQFVSIWRQIKEKIGFRIAGAKETRGDPPLAETWIRAQLSDDQTQPFRPDYRDKRHEFSQHIGC
jgi:hypothetical protein